MLRRILTTGATRENAGLELLVRIAELFILLILSLSTCWLEGPKLEIGWPYWTISATTSSRQHELRSWPAGGIRTLSDHLESITYGFFVARDANNTTVAVAHCTPLHVTVDLGGCSNSRRQARPLRQFSAGWLRRGQRRPHLPPSSAGPVVRPVTRSWRRLQVACSEPVVRDHNVSSA
jgi:hypothetical protein